MRKTLLIAASAFVLGAGTMAYVGQAARATTEPKAETYHMLELFGDVLTEVDRQYVTQVDDKKLIESAMEGMLTSLDPHSDYLPPDAYSRPAGPDPRRVRRPRAGDPERRRRGQGDLADRRHPGRARRHQAGRLHHRGRRPERARPARLRRGQADARQARRGGDADHRPREVRAVRRQAGARDHPAEVGHAAHWKATTATAALGLQREGHRRDAGRDQGPAGQGPAHEGPGARPAQQSRRPARPGGRRLQPVPQRRRSGLASAAATRRTSSATTPRATTC